MSNFQTGPQPRRAPTPPAHPHALKWPVLYERTIPQVILRELEDILALTFQISVERDTQARAVALGSGTSHHTCTCDEDSPPCTHGETPGALPGSTGTSDPTARMLAQLCQMPERTEDGRVVLVTVTRDQVVAHDDRHLDAIRKRLAKQANLIRWERGDPRAEQPERGPGRRRVLVSDGPDADHGQAGNRAAARAG